MTDCSDRLPKDYLKMVMIPNHNKFHQQKPVSKNPKLLDSIRRVLKSANHQDFSINIDKKSNYWNEIKTSGMNLSPRSYHSMDYYNG